MLLPLTFASISKSVVDNYKYKPQLLYQYENKFFKFKKNNADNKKNYVSDIGRKFRLPNL